MPGNYPVRTNGDQFSDGLGDDRLEEPAGQVETANEGVDLRDPGDALGIAEHVDRPGVATAGQYDQPFASDVDDHRLVVPDPRVGLPPIVGPSVLEGESLLEISHPFRLAAHEHRPVEEQRGAAFFDHLDALGGEVGSTRWGHVDLGAGGEDDASIPPGVGVQHERHAGSPQSSEHALQTGVVVGVSMGQDHRPQVGGANLEDIHVVHGGVAAETGVVEDRLGLPPSLHGKEQGEPVLGPQLILLGPLIRERRSTGGLRTCQQHVDERVDEYGHVGYVDRHRRCLLHRPASLDGSCYRQRRGDGLGPAACG